MNQHELRQELSDMVKDYDQSNIDLIREKLASLKIKYGCEIEVQSAEIPLSKFNCLEYALDLYSNSEYMEIKKIFLIKIMVHFFAVPILCNG